MTIAYTMLLASIALSAASAYLAYRNLVERDRATAQIHARIKQIADRANH